MNEKDRFIKSLMDLGLKDHEAKVYLATLKLGQAIVSQIAKEAGVQRTFAYDILEDLHERGIVSEIDIRGIKNYSAISIEQFKDLQALKFEKFEKLLPELKSFEKTVGDRPKVMFYEGAEGVKTALYDHLNVLKPGEEVIAYATAEGFWDEEPEFATRYMKDKVARKIYSRAIAVNTKKTRYYAEKSKEQLRTTRLVSAEEYPFSNEIDVYANRVAIINLQGELLAVIIESESIAKTQRAIFELAWRGAKNVKK